ncbi:MAG: hypothetical protein E7491_08530 [Ruminococcaceae bacterium]|nr:hypothetical protein [Oscillospiraceae bacterium]
MDKMLASAKKIGEDILVFFFAIPVFIRQFVENIDKEKVDDIKEKVKKALPYAAAAVGVIVLIIIIANCCKAVKKK